MDKIVFAYHGRYFVREAYTLEMLSAVAMAAGFETGLAYDQDVFGPTDNIVQNSTLNKIFSSDDNTAQKIARLSPKYAVFLADSGNIKWIEKTVSCLKKINPLVKTVLVSAKENSTHDIFCDHILLGEPEKVFEIFLSSCNGPKSHIIESADLADLKTQFLPDKGLFKGYINVSDSYMVYTSKGCYGECAYCEEAISAGGLRRRSPGSVISELLYAKQQYSMKEVIFKDAVFAYDEKWLTEFLQVYAERIAVPFKCFAEPGTFSAGIAGMLKTSGCYCVEFGIQTLNNDIRKNVLNRRDTLTHVKVALAACDNVGLDYDIDHMFGLPFETVSDHIEALRFYASLAKLNRIKCHNLVYYPNSDITTKALNAGILKAADIDRLDRGFHSKQTLKTMRFENDCFSKLFKILPLLNRNMIEMTIGNGYWKLAHFMPNMLVMLLQLIIGMRSKDKRFALYMKHYPKKIAGILEAA